jgi:hypothetical protein
MAVTDDGTEDKCLAVAVNSKIALFELDTLTNIAEADSQILVYKIKCVGNQVIVADVMKGLSVY